MASDRVDRDHVVEVGDYRGQASVSLAATQLGSAYTDSRKRRVVDEWVELLGSGPTPIRSLHLATRTPKRLFAALAAQTQLTSLTVAWGDYDDLQALAALQDLTTLRLRGAAGVRDLAPLAGLHAVQTLQIEGLRGLVDAAPVAGMRALTDLELGGDWHAPRNVRLPSVSFLIGMPRLRRLLLHTLVVDDLDYSPLLSLPELRSVRVMAVRGMTPAHDDLVDRLPWEA